MESFIWGAGGARKTPDQIARDREVAAALMAQGVDTSPVGHWTQGAARVANALAGVVRDRRADGASARNDTESQSRIAALLGGLGGSSGAFPAAPSAAPEATDYASGRVAQAHNPDGAAIASGLVQRGLPQHVADAFVMNMRDESGLNPGINEANPIVPGSRGGFGLYQLTGPRRRAYEAYAAQNSIPLDSVDGQLDFLMSELAGPEKAAAQAIMAAPDTGSAAAAIVNKFLRPAESHRASREARYLRSGGGQSAAMPEMAGSGAPVQVAQTGGINRGVLESLSSPYASAQERQIAGILLQQQMGAQQSAADMRAKQSDPMYQLGLEKARLELEAMRNPQPKQTDTMQNLAWRAQQAGLQPGTPEYQQFMATGGGKEGVTVNNIMGGEKFGEEFAKGDASALAEVSQSGMAAQRNLGRIGRLDELLASTPQGAQGNFIQLAADFGVKFDGSDNVEAARALINSLVPEQRPAGSGPMSDADLELFKQSLPRIINSPNGNQMIVNTMRSIAQYDAQGAEIVQRLRRGEIDRSQAFEALQGRQNPLAGLNDIVTPKNAPKRREIGGYVIEQVD